MLSISGMALLFGVILAPSAEPTYQVTRATGDHDFFFTLRQVARPVMTSSPDNSLSAWQALPFSWKFFGSDVAGYRVSDNGYITFDSTSKTSVPYPTTLPNPAAPKGAIFAYWADLTMAGSSGAWSNTVIGGTFGSAPNRTYVIYWMSIPTKMLGPTASTLSFAVALHEGGDFEVIYTSAQKGGPLAGTVGAVSLDGAASVLAAGPAFDFPAVGFGGEDDQSFYFKRIEKP